MLWALIGVFAVPDRAVAGDWTTGDSVDGEGGIIKLGRRGGGNGLVERGD